MESLLRRNISVMIGMIISWWIHACVWATEWNDTVWIGEDMCAHLSWLLHACVNSGNAVVWYALFLCCASTLFNRFGVFIGAGGGGVIVVGVMGCVSNT